VECLDAMAAGPAPVTRWLRDWLAPVWSSLYQVIDAVAARPPRLPVVPEIRPVPEVAAVRSLLDDADGQWRELLAQLQRIDWQGYGAPERALLGPLLAAHPYARVRHLACGALAGWDDAATLQLMAEDACLFVRSEAVCSLRLPTVTRSAAVAAQLWELLHEPRSSGDHARQTLVSWAAHAGTEAVAPLIAVARGDLRAGVRAEAIALLGGRQEEGALSGLADMAPALLASPPEVGWEVHIALLEALAAQGIAAPPAAEALRAVDHLHVQRALALLLTR
jgi:hypothetical protein